MRREPEMSVEAGERGGFTASWDSIPGVVGEGASAEEARRDLFDRLVDQLRAGISEQERARLRAFRALAPEERLRRVVPMLELTWKRR